jgi:hypothetical protein
VPTLTDLKFFCALVIKKYGNPAQVSEEQMAEEFIHVYLKGLPPNIRALKAVASCCGIRLETREMPKNLRGFNEVINGHQNIYYKKSDSLSGIENTILHEIREMLETHFQNIYPGYKPTKNPHLAANKFATAVLLPKEDFLENVYATGLDIIALSQIYKKSCSQVLLRMGEVLQDKLFFYGALYEPVPDHEDRWTLNYWTRSHNGEDLDANVVGTDQLFPRKGKAVIEGSLVDLSIKTCKSYFAPRITLTDETDDEGLIAISSPLLKLKKPLKVCLTVLLSRNLKLYDPQIEKVNPEIVDGFHQHF